MKIELLGALDENRLSNYLLERIKVLKKVNESIIAYLDKIKKSNSKEQILSSIDTINESINGDSEIENTLRNEINNLKEIIKNTNMEISESIHASKFRIVELNNYLDDLYNDILETINELTLEKKTNIVATAGRLSRYPGTVFDILETIEDREFKKNVNFASRVISMGHTSITDHDYCVFAIQDVSPVIEQIIIAERFASFTIKSRREVDFSNVGFYTPNFHDDNGLILANNEEIKKEYELYMKDLFAKYSSLVNLGISKEDARFILPYSYYSNILMGVDAHTLRDMIIKFIKTKYSKIEEVNKFGNILYDIVKDKMPYLVDSINNYSEQLNDPVDDYLNEKIDCRLRKYEILDKPVLLNRTSNIDDTILISSLMRRYQYSYNQAKRMYDELISEDANFKNDLMRLITFNGDKQELTQVNFEFQIPLSFAVLTHLTRHRTHQMLIPDFVPNIDLLQYKVPPKIKKEYETNNIYEDVFLLNKIMYDKFKNYGIREEDLVYFTLSGNMVNVITNMDGKTLEHILGLRECTKAQWETRQMAYGMHDEINKLEDAQIFTTVLGATCTTQGICNEGKESCGKVKSIKK